MAGQRGRDVQIKVSDGGEPESFNLIAGIRAKRISLSSRLFEVTSPHSAQGWRALIAEAGTKQIEVVGSGAFKSLVRRVDALRVLRRLRGSL